MPPLETNAAAPAATQELTAGSLISRTLSTWWSNVLKFGGFTAVLFVPVVLIFVVLGLGAAFGMRGGEDAAPAVGAFMGMFAIGMPLMVVALVVQMGGLTYGAVQHLANRPVQFGSMFSVGFRRLLPLIGAGIVASILITIGMMLLIVPGIILACGLAATVAVVVAEDLGPIDALKRSWELTRGYRMTIFLATLAIGLLSFVVQMVAALLQVIPVLGTIVYFVIYVLVLPLGTLVPAVAYHDLREVKEGASTEDLAKVFE